MIKLKVKILFAVVPIGFIIFQNLKGESYGRTSLCGALQYGRLLLYKQAH